MLVGTGRYVYCVLYLVPGMCWLRGKWEIEMCSVRRKMSCFFSDDAFPQAVTMLTNTDKMITQTNSQTWSADRLKEVIQPLYRYVEYRIS